MLICTCINISTVNQYQIFKQIQCICILRLYMTVRMKLQYIPGCLIDPGIPDVREYPLELKQHFFAAASWLGF